jgi:hypothetical protein
MRRERLGLAQARAALDRERAELTRLRAQLAEQQRKSGQGRRDEAEALDASDPLDESWVVQGAGSFLSWCAHDEDDTEARARGRRGPSEQFERLADAIAERMSLRLEARVAQAVHEALAREREALKDQREQLGRTAAQLERQRQALEARWEALRAGRPPIVEADTRPGGTEILLPPVDAPPRRPSDRLVAPQVARPASDRHPRPDPRPASDRHPRPQP